MAYLSAHPVNGRFLTCHHCGTLCRLSTGQAAMRCPVCNAGLSLRKPASLQRCWAYLIASVICYFPANLLPIMRTSSFMGVMDDTILSGVVRLWLAGSWHLAMVVFVASILVPLLKMVSLTFLLLSVQFRWQGAALARTRLFRLLEAIGPWSMLDIYVVGLLAALVNWQAFGLVEARPGALAFAAVVVLTLLATAAFDPRLIWDVEKDNVNE
jgi:paraquat-inducible protein A